MERVLTGIKNQEEKHIKYAQEHPEELAKNIELLSKIKEFKEDKKNKRELRWQQIQQKST